MKKLSIIIPVYNTEKYLSRCLDSAVNQTLKDIEIICVNDGSTDNSLKILQEYAKKDCRIKIINLKNNKGVSNARNLGIKKAAGKYIGFLDSDDYVDLNFYQKLYNKSIINYPDVVKGNIKIISSEPDINKEAFYDINKDIVQNKGYFYHSFTTAIYNLDFIKQNKIYFPNSNNFEDPYFSIKAAIYYKNIEVINNVYYYYCINNKQSLSNDKSDFQIFQLLSVVKKIIKLINNANINMRHYIVVYDFIFKIVESYILNKNLSLEVNISAMETFSLLISGCKYKKEAIKFYFFKIKKDENKTERKKLISKLKGDMV